MSSATISFIRACVPGSLTDSLDREPAAIRTCARLRWRAHSDINPGSQQARNPASHQSAAAILPVGIGRLREPVECGGPSHALRAPAFLQQGTRWILNLFRPQAAGKLFSFRVALVNGSAKPTNGVSNRFFFSPNYLSWLAAHVVNSSNGVGACPTKEFPKQERMFPRIA